MDSERIIHLLARRMGKSASEEELAELDELLSSHPEFHFFRELVESIQSNKQHAEPAIEEEKLVGESWIMLQQALNKSAIKDQGIAGGEAQTEMMKKKKMQIFFGREWMRIAAIWIGLVFLAGGGGYYLWKSPAKKAPIVATRDQVKMDVAYGAPKERTLPDGSKVRLNAESHIRYSSHFIQKKREVYLDGEAYFEVKHDAGHPFVVHAENLNIEVLGTAFNVEAYSGTGRVATTLISGKVRIQIKGKPENKIVLAPHEKLTVINNKTQISGKRKELKELSYQVKPVAPLKSTNLIPEVAWLQDKVAFQNERFGSLAKRLERRYDVHFVFNDNQLKQEKLSGVFENENIRKAMKLLQMTTPFEYQISKDTVYLNR